ncbi:MAG: NADH-quinone oxidoreductase subunit L [Acidobacteria bacterium]|nr:NADH-quinone oxidoreductase subunit L [Acidobacteriota bacterium]
MDTSLPLWLIPILPLLGAALNGLWGKRLPLRGIAAIAVGAVACSFLLTLIACLSLGDATRMEVYFPWIAGADFQVDFNLYLDPLSAVMSLIVTGVGLLIHIYSIGYMSGEKGVHRFFAYMNLFLFFMLTLVLAGNYLLLLVGWEGVGLCSYLLIGYYFRREDAADAGKKAFIVTRLGDLGFLIGLILLYTTFGSLDYLVIFPEAAQFPVDSDGSGTLTLIGLLLLAGAVGKSAQIPLYVWLPDAMLGPTPVSALIHAATMVTAGVYIIARSSPIYVQAPEALLVVAIIGCITALYAATIGILQTDIKRILAYSTISQLGYMVMACGVGAFGAAVFHLMTHAFFKALLFLGAGSVIHAMGGEQDIRKMGGLRKKIPVTFWTFLFASLALIGAFPFAGFFSKDEILWRTFTSSAGGGRFLWVLALLTAGLTAVYIGRLVFLTFFGESRADPEVASRIHESPKVMTVPLIVLAVLSLVGGWIGWPQFMGGSNHFGHWLEPALAPPAAAHAAGEESLEFLLMGLSLAVAALGVYIAYYLFLKRREAADRLAQASGGIYRLLLNKYYVDEIYRFLFVKPLVMGSTEVLWKTLDVGAIDGAVNLAARTTRSLGDALRKIQSGNIRSYAGWVVLGTLLLIGFMVTAAS